MNMGTSIYPLPYGDEDEDEDGDETKVWYPLGRIWGWGWMFFMGMCMG